MGFWILKALLAPVVWLFGRPTVDGAEHIPATGPVILASNHLAVADSFFLVLKVRRKVTFVAKSEYFTGTGLKGLLTRWFFTAAGQVPIDRSSGSAAQGAWTRRSRSSTAAGSGRSTGGHPLPRRPAAQGQDRGDPGGPGHRCTGDPGGDERQRGGQSARLAALALRPGAPENLPTAEFLALRGLQGRSARGSLGHRRADAGAGRQLRQEYVDVYAADVKAKLRAEQAAVTG